MKTFTWGQETQGLFDYSAKTISKSCFIVKSDVVIVGNGDDCILIAGQGLVKDSLVIVTSTDATFTVRPGEDLNRALWLPVKLNAKRNRWKLTEGTLVKLGRVTLKVLRIGHRQDRALSSLAAAKELRASDEAESCRICLDHLASPGDPLISPCRCSGSMKSVHVLCLKEWLRSRIAPCANAASYCWKDISCELCKERLPLHIDIEGNNIELITLPGSKKPFVLLEEYNPDTQDSVGVHILCLANKESLDLGRANDSQVRITDISVSRKHCTIRKRGDGFYVEDLNSKFGTLVKEEQVVLRHKGEVTLQVARHLLKLSVKRSAGPRFCCWMGQVRPGYEVTGLTEKVGTRRAPKMEIPDSRQPEYNN